MAAARTTTLAVLDTTGPEKLEVTVSYSKGGMSYWDYKDYPRGYWLHVSPVKIEGRFKTYMMGSGLKRFVVAAKRFGAKALDRAAVEALPLVDETVAAVCAKEGLTLASEAREREEADPSGEMATEIRAHRAAREW